MGVEFWLKLEALKLHLQDSENSFGEIFYIFKTTFYWCIFYRIFSVLLLVSDDAVRRAFSYKAIYS